MPAPSRRARHPIASEVWALDHASFDGLLQFFDSDRDRAAVRYEDVRRRLSKLFAWRGCTSPDEYVDRTLDRVAQRLACGADVRVADPYQYVHGVALNILREHWREPARRWQALEAAADAVVQAETPDDDARATKERALGCLDRCLARLPPRTRDLFLTYHARPGQIARRQQLAASLGIPLNALRIRVHRVRAAVERCVLHCDGQCPGLSPDPRCRPYGP